MIASKLEKQGCGKTAQRVRRQKQDCGITHQVGQIDHKAELLNLHTGYAVDRMAELVHMAAVQAEAEVACYR